MREKREVDYSQDLAYSEASSKTNICEPDCSSNRSLSFLEETCVLQGFSQNPPCNKTSGRLEFAHAWPSCAIRHLNQDHVASLPESSKDASLQGQSRQYRHWERRAEQTPQFSRGVTTRPSHNVHRLHRAKWTETP